MKLKAKGYQNGVDVSYDSPLLKLFFASFFPSSSSSSLCFVILKRVWLCSCLGDSCSGSIHEDLFLWKSEGDVCWNVVDRKNGKKKVELWRRLWDWKGDELIVWNKWELKVMDSERSEGNELWEIENVKNKSWIPRLWEVRDFIWFQFRLSPSQFC